MLEPGIKQEELLDDVQPNLDFENIITPIDVKRFE